MQATGIIYLHPKYFNSTAVQLTFINFKYKKQANDRALYLAQS